MLHHVCIHSCYYTSRVCQYFVDGECYVNYTSSSSESDCEAHFGGYFLHGRCYYHVRKNCSSNEYYQQCTCYPHRSSTYSNYTCYNINGYYTDNYCYYGEFNCSRYAYNGQCYSRVNELWCFSNLLHFCVAITSLVIMTLNRKYRWVAAKPMDSHISGILYSPALITTPLHWSGGIWHEDRVKGSVGLHAIWL